MKNRALATFILVLPFGLFVYFWAHPGAPRPPALPIVQPAQELAVAKALAANPSATAIIASNFAPPPQTIFYSASPKVRSAPAGRPTPLEFTNLPPAIVLESLRHAVHEFGSRFGGNPVGTNPEITRQLSGNNPKQINFLRAEAGMRLNASGELIDPWGTPYFFHQLSGNDMEIHSAGPDGIMWTSDDLVESE